MTLLNISLGKIDFSIKLGSEQMGINESVCVHSSDYVQPQYLAVEVPG